MTDLNRLAAALKAAGVDGVTRSRLAERLGIPRDRVEYHLRVADSAGLLTWQTGAAGADDERFGLFADRRAECPRHAVITEDDARRWHEMNCAGMTYRQIGAAEGASYSQVRAHVQRQRRLL